MAVSIERGIVRVAIGAAAMLLMKYDRFHRGYTVAARRALVDAHSCRGSRSEVQ